MKITKAQECARPYLMLGVTTEHIEPRTADVTDQEFLDALNTALAMCAAIAGVKVKP